MPVRLRIDCAYDGAAFAGWARQPGLVTVQGVLEDAIGTLARVPRPRLTVAGRTDAGVHARGQVAHVDLPVGAFTTAPGRSARPPGDAFVQRVNAILARDRGTRQPDVVVTAVGVAPPGFDARFSALWRCYRYRIVDSPEARDPLLRGHTLWHPRPLDTAAMARAVAHLVGEHDFLSFCRPRPGATTVRRLLAASVTRTDGVVTVELRADAFCHSMVRAIVGTLVPVGEGRREPEWMGEVLRGRHHGHFLVASPHGLTLEEVGYPDAADLAARAALTRAVRPQPSSSSASNTNSPESSSRSAISSSPSSAYSSPSSSTSEVNSE